MQIRGFQRFGVILKGRRGRTLGVAYGEILSAERLTRPWGGLRLHVRTGKSVVVSCRGAERLAIEHELRNRGVRIVDEWGAMITPTLTDFEFELARDPVRLRQSSDDA